MARSFIIAGKLSNTSDPANRDMLILPSSFSRLEVRPRRGKLPSPIRRLAVGSCPTAYLLGWLCGVRIRSEVAKRWLLTPVQALGAYGGSVN